MATDTPVQPCRRVAHTVFLHSASHCMWILLPMCSMWSEHRARRGWTAPLSAEQVWMGHTLLPPTPALHTRKEAQQQGCRKQRQRENKKEQCKESFMETHQRQSSNYVMPAPDVINLESTSENMQWFNGWKNICTQYYINPWREMFQQGKSMSFLPYTDCPGNLRDTHCACKLSAQDSDWPDDPFPFASEFLKATPS